MSYSSLPTVSLGRELLEAFASQGDDDLCDCADVFAYLKVFVLCCVKVIGCIVVLIQRELDHPLAFL